MGLTTDIEELKGARKKSFQRLVWAAGTALVSIVGTTSTLSWKMRGYVDELEQQNRDLRGEVVSLGRKLEATAVDIQQAKKNSEDAVALSDKAMFLARLAIANSPQRKP